MKLLFSTFWKRDFTFFKLLYTFLELHLWIDAVRRSGESGSKVQRRVPQKVQSQKRRRLLHNGYKNRAGSRSSLPRTFLHTYVIRRCDSRLLRYLLLFHYPRYSIDLEGYMKDSRVKMWFFSKWSMFLSFSRIRMIALSTGEYSLKLFING